MRSARELRQTCLGSCFLSLGSKHSQHLPTNLCSLESKHSWMFEVLGSKHLRSPHCSSPLTEAAGIVSTLSPSVLALWLVKQSDGLPLLQDWLGTAHDVYHLGYEGWRESIEVRVCEDDLLGKGMENSCLVPSKGFGRSSVLLFGVLFTFHKLKDQLSSEEVADFARRAGFPNAYPKLL